MDIRFNHNNRAEPMLFYLGTPDHDILCPLNGIRAESVKLTQQLNDTAELSFTYDQFVEVDGKKVSTNGYELLHEFMRIYVERVGWFILSTPQVSDDGYMEYKQVSAQSVDIELTNLDLVGFKVNCGTIDSIEMLPEDNVEYIDDVPFAKEQVRFYNPAKPELSLLHMALSYASVEGWSIGYVDDIPKVYRSYQDGELVEQVVQLKDEIGTFDIGSQSVFSFLTQDVALFFECLILFDIELMTINAYRPEHFGKDTNVTIGFRNLQNSNEVSVDKNSIYTRYRVAGDDKLGIEYVNFGHNMIENLSYFLNTKYMEESLIAKYQAWQSDIESKRYEYMECTRQYNRHLDMMTELMDRLPLDDCSTEWNKFSQEELLRTKDNYTAQKAGYESFYVDENGDFDEEKLAASNDANDYYQIRDVILRSIETELSNRELPTSEHTRPYEDSYKTDWKLYGIDELLVNLDFYKSQKKILEDAHYDIPYLDYAERSSEDADLYPPHTRDIHEKCYADYLDVLMQLDTSVSGTLANAYEERTKEYEALEKQAEEYQQRRIHLAWIADKKNWTMNGIDSFSKKELRILSRLYRDTDYTNNNMFLTDSDNQVTAIDEQLKLFDAAVADLEATSQPQYIYQTNLDNFLTMHDYQPYSRHLNLGDFLYLCLRDDYMVKLRLISCSFNPLDMGADLQIEFSNMVKTQSKRYDTTYLLGLGRNSSKNKITGSSGGSGKNEGQTLTAGLIRKILSSTIFNNKLTSTINQHFQSLIGQMIVAKNLEAEMMETVKLHAKDGFFEYLQSQLIAADKIVADSAVIKQLNTLTAAIKNAIIGTSSTETGIVVRLTAQNAQIEEAFIKKVIADYISVNDLKAGNINTDSIHIQSEDGCFTIIGNTQTFKDRDGHVRLQLGQDASGQFSFIVYDASGQGVIMDQNGIRDSAIGDGLIKNDMIADGAIQSDKINWASASATTDEAGNPIWNSAQITLNDSTLDIQFASILTSLNGLNTTMEGVQTTVNAVEKSILDKVWRTDLVKVTDKDGNTVSQSIVDLLVTHNVSLNGLSSTVKQVETTLSKKADQSSITTLTERISKSEQDAIGFRQTVEENYATSDQVKSAINQKAGEITSTVAGTYATKESVSTVTQKADQIDQTVKNHAGDITTLKQTATSYGTRITNAEGKVSTLTQDVTGIKTTVSGKQDSSPTAIRYIRDWLNGSSKDTNNYWVECKVISGSTNIASGLTPSGKNADLSAAAVTNPAAYTNNILLDANTNTYYSSVSAGAWRCLQLDLGSIRKDIDYIQIWHYYADSRACNHRLEISADGTTWKTLYNSDISGGYTETDQGRTYSISDTYIGQNISSIKQDMNSIRSTVETVNGQVSSFTQTAKELSTKVTDIDGKFGGVDKTINTLTGKMNEISESVNKSETVTSQTKEQLISLAKSVKEGEEKISKITQTSEKWEADFKGIGIGSNPQPDTNITLSSDGITVQYIPKNTDDSSVKSTKTVITTEKFAGYYDSQEVFRLDKDLTKTKRIFVENGVDTGAIKMLPKTYNVNGKNVAALVHIKSGGTS